MRNLYLSAIFIVHLFLVSNASPLFSTISLELGPNISWNTIKTGSGGLGFIGGLSSECMKGNRFSLLAKVQYSQRIMVQEIEDRDVGPLPGLVRTSRFNNRADFIVLETLVKYRFGNAYLLFGPHFDYLFGIKGDNGYSTDSAYHFGTAAAASFGYLFLPNSAVHPYFELAAKFPLAPINDANLNQSIDFLIGIQYAFGSK